MKAIRTRYHGHTARRGARVIATDSDGNHASVNPDIIATNDRDEPHRLAAYALCDKMGWKGELVGGGFNNDMFWVFADNSLQTAPSAEERAARKAGLQARHDIHGFYVLTDEEAEHEDAGNQSAGFDGRPHYDTLERAWKAARP